MTFDKVILELGGNPSGRTPKAIELATQMPDAFLLFSTVENPSLCIDSCKEAGISQDRFYLDYLAWDTVTNFTCTYDRILGMGAKELYVVTDGYHMERAMTIAKTVYLGNGVKLIPSPSSPVDHKEPPARILLDDVRAWIWKVSGQIIADNKVYVERMPSYQAYYCQAQQLLQ
jgi:uncharacterized SAM-binding protein YcdF (DUF218 family)